jgi:hypothetical protein
MADNLSPAAASLGLGAGDPESDEERRKRLLQQQQQRLVPGMSGKPLPGNGYGLALSPAGMSIGLG